MNCTACSMIEGFENSPQQNSTIVREYTAPSAEVYQPMMKQQCNMASQPCMYTAQGIFVCPKSDIGYCGNVNQTDEIQNVNLSPASIEQFYN